MARLMRPHGDRARDFPKRGDLRGVAGGEAEVRAMARRAMRVSGIGERNQLALIEIVEVFHDLARHCKRER
ncbi:MAG: hypothetical protein H7X93_13700 [Sphingomonadaceae bacterium]|nr:hypothetical protein [Sphingomonadaceae bacterium]